MADDELEAIRARRMAELQDQMQGQADPNNAKKAAEMKSKEDDMKNQILSQVLDQKARARLNTISLAKPEKGRMIENMLLNMARTGQLAAKLGESELKNLLEQVSEHTQKKTTVTFDRRRAAFDDSDDD